MKDSELEQIKNKYLRLVEKRDRLKTIKDKMKELEKVPEILEYKKMYDEYNQCTKNMPYDEFEGKTNKDLAYYATEGFNVTPTNNIYFYIASGIMDEDDEIEYVDAVKDNAVEYIFANIEELHNYKKIKHADLQEFLENNVVIYPQQKSDCAFCYQIARENFFVKAIALGQDTAVEEYKRYVKTGYPWKKM